MAELDNRINAVRKDLNLDLMQRALGTKIPEESFWAKIQTGDQVESLEDLARLGLRDHQSMLTFFKGLSAHNRGAAQMGVSLAVNIGGTPWGNPQSIVDRIDDPNYFGEATTLTEAEEQKTDQQQEAEVDKFFERADQLLKNAKAAKEGKHEDVDEEAKKEAEDAAADSYKSPTLKPPGIK